MTFSPAEKLTSEHETSDFDCGRPELNDWLRRFALVNESAGGTRTFVTCPIGTKTVAGYYALAAGSIEHSDASQRIGSGLARHPIPVIVLARLAVDSRYAGQGLGSALLKDALLRADRASDEIGVRAVLVHSKDDNAKRFYERYDFEQSPADALQLMVLMKDVRRILRGR